MAKTMERARIVSATEILRADHRRIRDLFERAEQAEAGSMRAAVMETIAEVEEHTALEERMFYPEARREIEEPSLVSDAEEAHRAAKALIAELKPLPEGPRFRSKFRMLAKTMLDHIQEEEEKLFPQAERSSIDLDELGRRMDKLERSKAARFLRSAPRFAPWLLGGVVLAAAALAIGFRDRLPRRRGRWDFLRR